MPSHVTDRADSHVESNFRDNNDNNNYINDNAGSELKEMLESINSFPKAPRRKSSNPGRKRRSTAIATDPTFRNAVAAGQEWRN